MSVTYLVCGASTFETESTRNWEFTLGNSLLTKQSITLKGNDGVSLRAEIGSLHTQYLCKTITCLNIKSFECNQSLSLTSTKYYLLQGSIIKVPFIFVKVSFGRLDASKIIRCVDFDRWFADVEEIECEISN